MRLTPLLALPLLLAACSGGSGGADATPTEDDGCGGASPPPGCVSASPTKVPYPSDAASIKAFTLPPAQPGELGRKDNSSDPSLRTASLTVTVPAGKYVSSQVVCQGQGDVSVTTQPDSQAAQTINCDGSDRPSELTVFSSSPLKTAQTYTFTLKATGPSRWFFAAIGRSA